MLFGVITGFYAYSFYWGSYLRGHKILNFGREYSGGSIIAVMFSVVFGSLGLGGSAPHLKAITEGRIGGKLAYDVIDQQPKIIPNEAGSKKITCDQIDGKIQFRNVSFTYPSRKDLQVLKNFSCVFEAGQTTALVGPSGSGKSTII